jgi:hypothetical protein
MKLAYTIDQTIAIENEAGYFDLHNCYDVVGARQEGSRCYVEFDKTSGSWVRPEDPAHLTLAFEQATYFHLSEELEFPTGLELIGFTVPEDHDPEWFMEEPGDEPVHMVLMLDDDAFIRIGAALCRCLTGPARD